jgi:hypothetical protein
MPIKTALYVSLILIACCTSTLASDWALGAPFQIACEGTLESRNGFIRLKLNLDQIDSVTDDDRSCDGATIAEKGSYPWSKYELKENAVSQILRTCSSGKPCRIVGYMRGLSHGEYIWTKMDSVSAK